MKTLSRTLRVCARLHCGFLAAILSAAAFALLPLAFPSVSFSPYAAFWRGILFAVPTALCYYAIKRLPALWQFLPCALGLCALSWLLLGHPGGAALMAVMCLFRIHPVLFRQAHPASAEPVRGFLPAQCGAGCA